MKYSIWVIPPEPIYSQLKTIIDDLAGEFDGPTFEPHMTLVGDIDKDVSELEKKLKELSKNIEMLEL